MITKINKFKQINEMGRFINRTQNDDDKRNSEIEKRKSRMVFHVDEPTDDEVIKEDGLTPYKNTLNTDWLEMKINAKEPFFVQGHAGWGKTTIIKNVAKAHGLTVITVYLDKAQPEDLGGLPIPSTKEDGRTSVSYALPAWAEYIYERPEDDFLVFFDEMNQASPEVQNALMPILLESVIGGIYFDNVWYGAAGNFSEENASVSELSAPLRSRFIKENIWNEEWTEAFEYITDKYNDKLPENLLNTILQNNICMNPRELSKMLDAIISLKNNAKRQYDIKSIHHRINGFNHLDKTAETKKIVEEVHKYLYTNQEQEQERPKKQAKVTRAVLSQAMINQYTQTIKNGGYFDNEGEFVDLSGDWAKTLNITPEEAELIKKNL
jgi:MoxR-like ATPase